SSLAVDKQLTPVVGFERREVVMRLDPFSDLESTERVAESVDAARVDASPRFLGVTHRVVHIAKVGRAGRTTNVEVREPPARKVDPISRAPGERLSVPAIAH